MHKLSVPVFLLALAAPAVAGAQTAATAPPSAGAGATASASASLSIKVTDQEALDDDILAVIDLPVAAAEARAAGVEEADLKEALETTRDVGLSAGEATEVVTEEVEATKKRGSYKKGFGQWVKMQVAAGLRGKKLAAKIKERKAELKELTPEEQDKIKAKLGELGDKYQAHRLKVIERRQELIAKGKKKVLVAQDRHEKRKAWLAEAQVGLAAKGDVFEKRLKALDEKIAAASGEEKASLEAERKRLEQQLGKLDKAEDKLEKREDKLEKHDARLDAKLDKMADKAEKREEKREEKLEAKHDKTRGEAKGEGHGEVKGIGAKKGPQ